MGGTCGRCRCRCRCSAETWWDHWSRTQEPSQVIKAPRSQRGFVRHLHAGVSGNTTDVAQIGRGKSRRGNEGSAGMRLYSAWLSASEASLICRSGKQYAGVERYVRWGRLCRGSASVRDVSGNGLSYSSTGSVSGWMTTGGAGDINFGSSAYLMLKFVHTCVVRIEASEGSNSLMSADQLQASCNFSRWATPAPRFCSMGSPRYHSPISKTCF